VESPGGFIIHNEYGALKALCERAVEAALPECTLVVRPGLIVGRYDYTGRFSYRPDRIARGGEVLAPAPPDERVWFIGARDLAEWTIRLVEQGTTGSVNATGPVEPLTMRSLLEECRAITGSDATFVWVPDPFLLENDVKPYQELPLWVL
jgi:2'-hydroxyisoflavone reductase